MADHFNERPEFTNVLAVASPDSMRVPPTYSIYPDTGKSPSDYDAELHGDTGVLLDYLKIIGRHKLLIALSALLGTIMGMLVGLPMTPVYRASASLEVLNINQDFMNTKQSSPVTTPDYSYDTSEEDTQVRLLQSDSLLERVYQKLDPNYQRGKLQPRIASSGWRKLLILSDPDRLTDRERLLSGAAASIKIRTTPRTRIIELSADSTDPVLASDFVNTMAQQFIEQNLEAKLKTTQTVSDWLSGELEDTRNKLQHSEDTLQAYARTSGLIFTADDTNIATEKLQQLQQQLSQATADRATKQSNYELAKSGPVEALPAVLDDQSLRDALTLINTKRADLANLSARFTPEYSKVKSAEAELSALESAFERDRKAIVGRINNDYEEALRKETLLVSIYNAQAREVAGQGEKAVQYNILKREVDSNRQLYDTMLQTMKQSSIGSALRASNVRVADPAALPEKPIWPNFKITAAFGFLCGLLSSIAVVTIRDRTNRTMKAPGDVKLWTNLPELGTIPKVSAVRKGNFYDPLPQGKKSPTINGVRRTAGSAPVELITWQEKPGVVAEAFRSALTSILFVGENGTRPRVLVLTSGEPSDGKTTVVSNLAIAMAEIGRRTLIIDADLRRPRMHTLFDVSNDRGLSDVLEEHHFSEEMLTELVQPTKIAGLSVLPAGPSTHAAANLLHSPNLRLLLSKLRNEYDMIMIDTPPMLQMTDARVVGRLADGVILVVRAGRTTRDAVVAATQRFIEDRVRVLGTVLNDWDPKISSNGYYGYYRPSPYYRPSGDNT
jgi:succinoglycan biosynthesis transport protein ExoP